MVLKDQNILFFTRTMKLGGTENVILQLCEIFKPLVNRIVVCSCGGVNEEKLDRMGIKHFTIPDIENKSIRNLVSIPKYVQKIIRNEKITVVHTHHRMAAFYTQLLCMKGKVIKINTSHTAFYDKKRLSHIAFRSFNLIACGEGVKKSLVEGLGFNPNRITVICNGVKRDNVNRTNILEIENARKQGKYVFAVIGRLSEEKGVTYLIKAIPLLKTTKICCVVVGNGPDEPKIRKLVKELGISDKIVFLGFRNDVANILSQVDFVVQPSLQEGLPLTPIEAFSQGKPVVGTNIDGTAEIIRDGVNGFLVPPGDPKPLAEAIDCICGSNIQMLGEMALKEYKEKYSFDVFAQHYIDYYEKI